ncbi:MAG: hypothetical protein LBU65_07730 [Planctomycetaceae bacterium]|nr:hypothetical protein [Planctomycetaceae bacterium]
MKRIIKPAIINTRFKPIIILPRITNVKVTIVHLSSSSSSFFEDLPAAVAYNHKAAPPMHKNQKAIDPPAKITNQSNMLIIVDEVKLKMTTLTIK